MAYAEHLRRHFPALRTGTYLNTASYGLLPDTAVEAMQRTLSDQLSEGRRRDGYDAQLAAIQHAVCEQLAHLLGADPGAFALTGSATQAFNTLFWSFPFRAGDEVIVTDAEHPAVYLPLASVRRRLGIVVRVVPTVGSDDALCDRVESLVGPRTRLIVAPHVAYRTGRRLPVERLADLARDHGVHIAVDGAQGAGADPVDLRASGVDFYVVCGQKWLCGPDGTGALYVRPDLCSFLDPAYVGTASLRTPEAWDASGYYVPAAGARRFAHEQTQLTAWTGLWASLQFLRVQAGWEYVFTRTRGLSGELINRLLDVEGVEIITPREARAGLVTLSLPSGLVDEFASEAKARSLEVRVFQDTGWVRVSTALYNSEDDIERFVEFVKRLMGSRRGSKRASSTALAAAADQPRDDGPSLHY